jgi:hypothetical protein
MYDLRRDCLDHPRGSQESAIDYIVPVNELKL